MQTMQIFLELMIGHYFNLLGFIMRKKPKFRIGLKIDLQQRIL